MSQKIDLNDFRAWQKDKVTKAFIEYIKFNKEYLETHLHSQQEMLKEDGQKRFCIYLGGLEIVNNILNLELEDIISGEDNNDDRET